MNTENEKGKTIEFNEIKHTVNGGDSYHITHSTQILPAHPTSTLNEGRARLERRKKADVRRYAPRPAPPRPQQLLYGSP